MADVLILNREEMESLLTLEAVVPVIEKAFVAFADGRTVAYPVVREEVRAHRGIFGIKSGYLMDEEVIGLKAGGFWLGNPERGITAHQSTTVMFDPRTGLPTALMDGNHITTIRTAAVGALAARCLARKDARVAAVLGTGTQGIGQAEALCHVLPIETIRAYDPFPRNLQSFTDVFQARGVAVDERMRAYALSVQNYFKAGEMDRARENLGRFRQAFPENDLYYPDGSSFTATMEVLLGQKKTKGGDAFAMLNVNDELKDEVHRIDYWRRN